MTRFSGFAAVAIALSLAACAGPADNATSQQSQGLGVLIVDSIPTGYVETPHGLYHQSCVHELPDGAEVDASGNVLLADGTTQTLAACGYQRAMLRADATAGTTNGWVEYAAAFVSAPATQMTARFTVPPAPASASGQLVYFFPGMEPSDGTIILQPVLQWGQSPAGGGNSWGIASWSCGPSCVHSKLGAAKAGDVISGSITGSKCSATGQCAWKIVTTDSTSGHSTTLNTKGDTASYTWLQSGVLEAYNVSACAQYPTAPISFSKVEFSNAAGALFAPAWAPDELGTQPSCNFNVAPSSAGAVLAY